MISMVDIINTRTVVSQAIDALKRGDNQTAITKLECADFNLKAMIR